MTKAAETTPDPAVQPPPFKLSRTLHARREAVFRAWSQAEHVRNWFPPEPYTGPEARVELRVGGPFEVLMRSPSGEEHWTRGTFLEVVANERLVIDMTATDAAGKVLFRALTEVEFTDAFCGMRLDVTQTYTLFDPEAAAPMVAGAPLGWKASVDQMEREAMRIVGAAEVVARSVVHATFHLERTYDAPPARVWKALVDQGAKAKWFTGPPAQCEVIERTLDVRPGGRERLYCRWEGGTTSGFDATYHEVIPVERLVYSYEMHMSDRKISVSLATVQLEARAGKTVFKLTEQGAFLDGYDDAGSREEGTGLLLDALGASLAD